MNKKDLRIKYKALRQEMTTDEVEDKSLAIANNLLQLNICEKIYYHLFLTIEEHKEIQTEFILHLLAGRDKEIVVSKSDFENAAMKHYLLTDNTRLVKNHYGIPEPADGIEVPVEKLDVIFVPVLGYDVKGNRTGYGKGFYDRFLAGCRQDVIKVGLSFFEPEDIISDIDENDIPLDYCVTPKQVFEF